MSQGFASKQQTKLEQFSHSFKDEKDLRLALIALLEKLPNTTLVRHMHGAQERGKDIVFTSAGAFATEETVACVVKNAPITGSAQSDEGARTVYNQAEQCLDTPFLNSKGESESVNRVFVITPFECTQIAIESIKGKLAKPDAVVRFLYGRELYELFQTFYPEYLVFRSGLFGSYITDLEKGISKDAAVATLLMKHGLSGVHHEISRVYVQPTLEIIIAKQFLMTEWPDPGGLRQPIFVSEIDAFAARAIEFGRFLALLVPAEMAAKTRAIMDELALAVRSAWKQAFEEYRSSHSLLGVSESGEKKRTPLSMPTLNQLNENFSQRTPVMRTAFENFMERLERANELAQTNPQTLAEFLAHPNRHDYSYVRGVAAQMPAVFEDSIVVSSVIHTDSQTLIASGEDLLLTGPAGFGKSSFCRWNVLHDLRGLKDGTSNVVPVLVSLHQLDGEVSGEPTALFEARGTLRELWATRCSANGSKVHRRFRLYLDGLDEVPDPKRQRQLASLALQLKNEEPLTQLIYTGREHVAGSHLGQLSRLHVAEMCDSRISSANGSMSKKNNVAHSKRSLRFSLP